MAIAYQNSVASVVNTSPSAFDVGSGDDRFLLVGTFVQANGNVTGVTYNGVSMTLIATIATNSDVATNEQTKLWGLINPASGSNNIALSVSGGGTYGFAAVCYNGVDQTTGFEAANTSNDSDSSPATVSVTTVADNSWVAGFIRTSGTWVADSNTVSRGSTNVCMGDSNSAVTPAGAYAIGYTDNEPHNMLACAIIPVGSTDYDLTAAVGTFTLTGVASALKIGRKMLAAVGTFALTGYEAALSKGKIIVASVGAFTLTGKDSILTSTRKLIASVGAFTLTGKDAILTWAKGIKAGVGSFALTFKDVIIKTSIWVRDSKPSDSYTNNSKPTDSYNNDTKPSNSWVNDNK